MLARGPAGRGVGTAPAAPFVNALIPARQPPPPEAGTAQSFRWHGSKFMLPDEIDSILRIQWKSLHNGAPYQEDYYYQAMVNKKTKGGNSRLFTPDALRDLAPAEKMEEEPLAYVRLEGLGKIPYSDVKRPKPIMDLVAGPNEEQTPTPKGNEEGRGSSKPLEQEPLLAARIVIEDCMCLLLDIDDIDRVCHHIFRGRDDQQVASLRRRRTLLLEALASSLRLPHTNVLPTTCSNGQQEETDAVLKRLIALEKGRKLLARLLSLLKASVTNAPQTAPAKGQKIPVQRILWATLRISTSLFSTISPHASEHKSAAERESAENMMDITTEIALALIDVIGSLGSGEALVECMTALVNGDLGMKSSEEGDPVSNLLPLLPSGEPVPIKRTWLADVISCLMMCAERKGILGPHPPRPHLPPPLDHPQRHFPLNWAQSLDQFWTLFHRHLTALADVYSLAKQSGAHSAANYAREMIPRGLVEAFLSHSTQDQQTALIASLSRIFQS